MVTVLAEFGWHDTACADGEFWFSWRCGPACPHPLRALVPNLLWDGSQRPDSRSPSGHCSASYNALASPEADITRLPAPFCAQTQRSHFLFPNSEKATPALSAAYSSDANIKHYDLDLEPDDLRDSNTECMLRPQMMATIGPSAP